MRRMEKNIGRDKICAVLCCMALLVASLAGCGSQTEEELAQSSSVASSGSEEVASSVGVDIESLLQAGTIDKSDLVWAGAQYIDGEAVTVWRGANGTEDFATAQDIYVEDSKGILTKVVSGASGEYTEEWYYTTEGYSYAIFENKLVRIEADGTETYTAIIGADIQDICRLEKGQLLLVIQENAGNYYLADVDEATGEFEIVEGLDFGRDSRTYIAEGENGLLLLNSKGLWNVNLDAGELVEEIPMSEYDIRLPYTIKDFRVLGGASLAFLHRDEIEVIHPKDIEKYREIVTMQVRWEDQWLSAMVDGFNDSNEQYYAVLEPLMVMSEDGSKMEGPTPEQVEKELAGGGGADLLTGDCADSSHLIEMGYLEDLAPYMEKAGMDMLDYFPATFEQGKRGESIYMANLYLTMSGLRIKEDILGSREKPNVETLLNSLLSYMEPSVLNSGWAAEDVAHYLLAGSEDLHGIIDWEGKTCNFQSDFFAKVLEVSKLYGDDGGGLPALGELYDQNAFYNYINEEQLELAEEVYLGYLFEEGCYPCMSGGISLSINNNSNCKDGAWAVVEYLLGEEAQTQKWLKDDEGRRLDNREYPVNVYAFEAVILLEQEETSYFSYQVSKTGWLDSVVKVSNGIDVLQTMGFDVDAYRARYDLTETDIEEIRELVYEVRILPEKPEEILEIVCEEALAYFNDERSLGDTCEAIQERAQAYLEAYEEQG